MNGHGPDFQIVSLGTGLLQHMLEMAATDLAGEQMNPDRRPDLVVTRWSSRTSTRMGLYLGMAISPTVRTSYSRLRNHLGSSKPNIRAMLA
jgi:hypothetical protein